LNGVGMCAACMMQGNCSESDVSGWEEIGYDPKIQIIPVEGYLDQDNDFRQIYRLYRDEENLKVEYAAPRNEIYPYHLVGYHPIIKENAPLMREICLMNCPLI
jgi:hypothetical protein